MVLSSRASLGRLVGVRVSWWQGSRGFVVPFGTVRSGRLPYPTALSAWKLQGRDPLDPFWEFKPPFLPRGTNDQKSPFLLESSQARFPVKNPPILLIC
jgi:hypothetical protein